MGQTPATTTARIEVAAALLQSKLATLSGNNNNAAGMQLAIWSILYNPVLQSNITSGSVFQAATSTAAAIVSAANSYLSAASLNLTPSFSDYNQIPFYVQSNGSQVIGGNQIVVGVVTPEPQTYFLLGGFLICTSIYYYWKKKSAVKIL